MTNPNNAVGTNGAYGGRTSVDAFNDITAFLTKGVVSGWDCVPSSGMTVAIGGVSGTRDVALAQDNAGNKVTVNNISGQPIEVEFPDASSEEQIYYHYIVAYVNNSPQGVATAVDNPSACGIITVAGASSQTYPTEADIRTAITADGGEGDTAYFVVLRCVMIPAGATEITADDIQSTAYNDVAKLAGTEVVKSQNIDFTTLKGSTSLPYVEKTVPGGWGASLTLTRVGNLVIGNIFGGNSLPSTDGQWATQSETVPVGFRPAGYTVQLSGMVAANRGFTQAIESNGIMRLIVSAQWTSGSTDRRGTATWFTKDAWPS